MTHLVATWVFLAVTAGPAAPQAPAQNPPAEEPAPAPPVAPGAPAVEAPAPEAQEEVTVRRIDIGLLGPETDTNSSRFREYRAIPSGPVVPFFRLAGGTEHRYDVSAENALQEDARYRVMVEPGPFRVESSFVKIPHRFGNEARSLLERTGPGTYVVEDTIQRSLQGAIEEQFARNRAGVNFAFLNALVLPAVTAQTPFDLKLQRDRGRVEMTLTRDLPVDVRLSYAHEKRHGTRESGTAFGFSNVVQSPEPIDYRTQDLGLSAEWGQGWGLLRGGLRFNLFNNAIAVQTFDNPFRATNSTDPSAYQAPGSASVNGPAMGRIALPPDSRSVTGSLGGVVKFGKKTRLTADASYGQWTQDDPFIALSSNPAINAPFDTTDPAHLPARDLDGKIAVLSLSSALSVRPARGLGLTARFRRYDLDNQTPRIRFEDGYVRFDSAFEDIPRISVPYGYTNDQALASASYDLGRRVTVEGGYRFDRMHRTFRETEKTTQNTLFGSALLRMADWAILRASVERGSRDFDGAYHGDEAEHASFLDPGPAVNLPSLRRYDQASKDTTRVSTLLQVNPVAQVTLSASYLRARDDYQELDHGLVDALNEAVSFEADYTPNERLSVYAFFTRENIESFQVGRQSGATPSANPLDDWTADLSDTVDFYGAGGTAVLLPGKLDLRLMGTFQEVDGLADLFSAPGGAPDVARRATGGVRDIAEWDDTRLLTVLAELGWTVDARWRLSAGGWLEDYEVRDLNTQGLTNYVPGSFFLAPVDSDYRGYVLYTRASYTW
jgi:MtrB/PioB family decaheme-associated outer membrane protein